MVSIQDLHKFLDRLPTWKENVNTVGENEHSMEVDEGDVVFNTSGGAVLDANPIEATASSLAMPAPAFPGAVTKDPSIAVEQLCDIELPGFDSESKLCVRFRKRDNKVFTADLLVRMNKFKTVVEANDAILELVKNGKAKKLKTIEIDKTFLLNVDKSLILMSLPDAIELLHRIDANSVVDDGIVSEIEGFSTVCGAKDAIIPARALAVVSSAVHPAAVKIRMRKVPASMLKTISGLESLDDSYLDGRLVRQVEPGQLDEAGEDAGGKWAIKDSVCACTGDKAETSIKWVKNPKNVNKTIAKSLAYVTGVYSSVSRYELPVNTNMQRNSTGATSSFIHLFQKNTDCVSFYVCSVETLLLLIRKI